MTPPGVAAAVEAELATEASDAQAAMMQVDVTSAPKWRDLRGGG